MTAAIAVQERLFSIAEYLEREEKSEVKHEFQNGKIIEMAGGTFKHNRISARIIRALENFFIEKKKPCFTLTSDQKVYIPATNRIVYPDGVVVCEKPEGLFNDPLVLTNPTLIVEVLSESTEAYDRGRKFDNYCSIPSFREYLLLDQERPYAEVFYLHDPETDLWKITRASGLEASIYLQTIDFQLPLREVYAFMEGESA
ncbi:MAG: Uma2 family endonuclease [Saprospiraceae bacterium]